jgi:hypothetical protein
MTPSSQLATTPASLTGGKRIAMYVTTGLVGLGMLASAAGKLSGAAPIVENFSKMHLTPYLPLIALIEIVAAVTFLVRKTSSLGTLLVTGYFGGAVVGHLASQTAGEVVPALVLGALAWVSNLLRNPNMFESFRR